LTVQHEVLAAVAQGQSVILCNHTNTERGYLKAVLQPWLEAELNSDQNEDKTSSGWQVVVSTVDADPLHVV
jgi:putative NIF3 family GTP cyclohydrolase 1 type 2